MNYSKVFKSPEIAALPGHKEHPTVEVMKGAIAKLGEQGFEDAVVAHLESLGREVDGRALAREVEYVARKTVGLIKKDDYSAADPSPAPSITTQDLAEHGGLKILPKPPKKKWLQRVRDKFKRTPLDVQPVAKGLAHVFDKQGK